LHPGKPSHVRSTQPAREIGFFTITGHGVPIATMDQLRSKAHAFFALPLEEKRSAIHPVPGMPRGYRAQGLEALAQASAGTTPPDLKEFYHFGRESWPNERYYTEGRRPELFHTESVAAQAAGLCRCGSSLLCGNG